MNFPKKIAIILPLTIFSLTGTAASSHDITDIRGPVTLEASLNANAEAIGRLTEAVRNFGIDDTPVPESYAEVRGVDMAFASMALKGYSQVSAANIFEAPVPFGIAYHNAPSSGIEPGVYLLQIQSNEQIRETGVYNAVLSLRDQAGNVVFKRDTTLDVFSMTPSPINGWEGTVITPMASYVGDGMEEGYLGLVPRVEKWCTNGMHTTDSPQLSQ